MNNWLNTLRPVPSAATVSSLNIGNILIKEKSLWVQHT